MFRLILIPEKKGEIKMFEMNVPYDKGQMKIKLEDKNLAGVLEGRQVIIKLHFQKMKLWNNL